MRKDDIVHIKALLLSEAVELGARKEQLSMLTERMAGVLKDMDAEAASRAEAKAARAAVEAEEQYLHDALDNLLGNEVNELQVEMEKARAAAREAALEIDDDIVREVSVQFETEDVVMRVNEMYNFESLKEDSCRYFEVHPLDMLLVNADDEEWPPDAAVRDEMERFDNQYGRVHLKFVAKDEEDELGDDPEDLIALIAGNEQPEEEEAPAEGGGEEEAAASAPVVVAPVGEGDVDDEPKAKELDRRTLLMEMPSFLTFMVVFTMSLSLRRQVDEAFYQINAIRTALFDENFGDFNEKAYEDIASFGEMFDWLENVFVPGVFPDEDYNGEELASTDRANVMVYNRLIGAIRFRTVRSVPNKGCNLAKLSRRTMVRPNGSLFDEDFMTECYTTLDGTNEDSSPYGPALTLMDTYGECGGKCCPIPGLDEVGPHGLYTLDGTPNVEAHAERTLCDAFTYMSAAETKEEPITTQFGTYPGGGFVRDVLNPINCEPVYAVEATERADAIEAIEPAGMCTRGMQLFDDLNLAIEQIKSGLWMDAHTRAIFIKCAFYNGNTNTFVTVIFILEFTRGGVLIPSAKFGSVMTEPYAFGDPDKLLPIILEFTVYAFNVKNIYIQVSSIIRTYRKERTLLPYFSDIWNVVELAVLTILLTSLSVRFTLVGALYPPAVIFLPTFTDYSTLAELYAQSFNLDGFCVVALFFQLFKYLQLSDQANMLWSVLTKSGVDVMYFVLMFFILLLGFGLMGEQMLGTNLEAYSSPTQSIINLFIVLMGAFDVDEFEQASEFGLAYFMTYITVMFLILMNIFLAILGEAYSMVREEADEKASKQVKTKTRSAKEWVQLLWTIFKKKRAARRAAKEMEYEDTQQKAARLTGPQG